MPLGLEMWSEGECVASRERVALIVGICGSVIVGLRMLFISKELVIGREPSWHEGVVVVAADVEANLTVVCEL